MAANVVGREEIVARVQTALGLVTKKEAETTTKAVLEAVSGLINENIGTDGFTLKIADLGKFTVKHVAGTLRKNPFKGGEITKTRDKRKVKFATLGKLRDSETV